MPRLHLLMLLLAVPALLVAGRPARRADSDVEDTGRTVLSLLGSAYIPLMEQVAYDDTAKVAYCIGGSTLTVVDLSPVALLGGSGPAGATLPVLLTVPLGRDVNDVVSCGQFLALALNGATKTDPGSVQLHRRYDAARPAKSLELLDTFTVGSQPDQIEFSKHCRTILVSNEAEPSGYGAGYTDPEGSVSIIRLGSYSDNGRGYVSGRVTTADFRAWNGKKDELLAQGIKINGPGSTVAQDLEPEYTTFAEDGKTAFVSLQENNAIAILDVWAGRITAIHPLGLKDHNLPANKLDASDRDGGPNITNSNIYGMYMPDEIKSFRHRGVDYVVGANEGDAREWPGFVEEGKVNATKLDAAAFPDAAVLAQQSKLGRIAIVNDFNKISDPDQDGLHERLLAYGARSFSIWKLNRNPRTKATSLTQVFDSGSQLEDISLAELPTLFNSEGTTNTRDGRSDNKGPEPEGVAVGPCAAGSSRRCLFLTTERLGAVFVYDISNPAAPVYQSLALAPQTDGTNQATRFRAPEGITYASYSAGSSKAPIVLVAYEGGNGVPGGLGVFRVSSAA